MTKKKCTGCTSQIFFILHRMKSQTEPIIKGEFLLEKFPGKGGWTYAQLPGVTSDNNNPFGWRQVMGNIDSYSLKQYKLMPMGNGHLFLPVKSAIRKSILKEAGDTVSIVLYDDYTTLKTPKYIKECLADVNQDTLEKFENLPSSAKNEFIRSIDAAKRDETKAKRILKLIAYLTG